MVVLFTKINKQKNIKQSNKIYIVTIQNSNVTHTHKFAYSNNLCIVFRKITIPKNYTLE